MWPVALKRLARRSQCNFADKTRGLSSYIVKLEGLLEMRGLARLSLQRKENRQVAPRRNGQNVTSYQVRAVSKWITTGGAVVGGMRWLVAIPIARCLALVMCRGS